MSSRAYGIHAISYVPSLSHQWMRFLAGCILIIALCAPPVAAIHLTKNTFFAQWTMDDSGSIFPSSPRSTFNSSDPWILSYVMVENPQGPFSVTWKFYSPSGIYYFYEVMNSTWSGGIGYSSIIEPTSLFLFEPGKWRVDLEYNGIVERSDTFYIEADPAYPVGIENPTATTSNLHIYRTFLFSNFTTQDGAFSPRDPRTKFTDADHWIVPFVLLKDVQPGDLLTWEFYSPSDTLEYNKTSESGEYLASGYDEYHLMVGSFLSEPGTWRLVLRYNGQEEVSRSFSVQAGPSYSASVVPTSTGSPTNTVQQSPDPGNPILIPALAGAGILTLCIAGAVIIGKRRTHQGVPTQPPVKITPSGTPSLNIPHDVFICYSSTDKPVADAICARLEAKGIRCWIAPRDVLPGLPYQEALITAIDTSRILVMVFSSSANDSPHVLRELTRAVDKNVIIIPFRIEDVQPSNALAYILSVPHWLDALTPPLEEHIERLANTISRFL